MNRLIGYALFALNGGLFLECVTLGAEGFINGNYGVGALAMFFASLNATAAVAGLRIIFRGKA